MLQALHCISFFHIIFYIFFILSSINEHLGGFHISAIVSNASGNLGVVLSLQWPMGNLLGPRLEVGILDHMAMIFLRIFSYYFP